MGEALDSSDEHDYDIVNADSVPAPKLPTSASPEERIAVLRKWLQPTDYLSPGNEYMKHLRAHVTGTGSWLLGSPAFLSWEAEHLELEQGTKPLLWLKGMAGSGKSVCAASIAAHLQETYPQVPVLYFFFREIVSNNHSPEYLVRDFAAQLLPYSPLLLDQLAPISERQGIRGFELTVLWRKLRDAVRSMDRVFCVVDALDEMTDRHFPHFIHRLANLANSRVRVLVTSRPIDRIEQILGRHPQAAQVILEPSLTSADILTYVEDRLAKLRATSELSVDDKILKSVRDGICQRSQGLFLYARLILDNWSQLSLSDELVQGDDESLLHGLQQLPVGLAEVYEKMLEDNARKSGITQADQVQILQCVIYASRPLRLIELASLVSRTLELPQGLKAGKDMVRQSCGQLLEILEDETVSVIHHSFTEFLRAGPRSQGGDAFPVLKPEEAHETLTKVCLQYLDGCDMIKDLFGKWPLEISVDKAMLRLRMEYPLLGYAESNWHLHAQQESKRETSDIFGVLDTYLQPNCATFLLWVGLYLEKHAEFSSWDEKEPIIYPEPVLPIHMATVLGLDRYVEHLVTLDIKCLNTQSPKERSPLFLAVINNQVKVVRVLLAYGAEPDSPDGKGLKPIHYAAMQHKVDIVRALLGAGVNPLSERTKPTFTEYGPMGDNGDTAFKFASKGKGNPEMVRLFLDKLGDIEIDLSPYLHWSNNVEILDILLQTGKASADSFMGGSTRLYRAAAKHDLGVMQKLLEYGADPNKRVKAKFGPVDDWTSHNLRNDSFAEDLAASDTFNGPTPMHSFAMYQEKRLLEPQGKESAAQCLEALLAAGGDLEIPASFKDCGNAITQSEYTPLHCAVHVAMHWTFYCGGPTNVEAHLAHLLLKNGANLHAVTGKGNTALNLVSPGQDPELLVFLLDHGAGVNARSGNEESWTPLLHLVQMANKQTNIKHEQRQENFIKTVQMLLERGADARAVTKKSGNTVLHCLLSGLGGIPEACQLSLVRLLLEAGVDPNQVNYKDQPPLSMMSGRLLRSKSSQDMFRMLVDAGMDLSARNARGESYIWLMANDRSYSWSHEYDENEVIDTIQLLSNLGVDLGTVFQDDTVLRSAIEKQANVATVKFLVEKGANPLTKDRKWGETLIHTVLKKWSVTKEHNQREETGLDMIKALIEMGVSPSETLLGGQTVLHFVNWPHHLEDVRQWIDVILDNAEMFGTQNINGTDLSGATAVHYAAATSEWNVSKLLRRGADPTILTSRGVSALQIAARSRQPNTMALLLDAYEKRGPQVLERMVNHQDHGPDRRTALHLAVLSGRAETVLHLLEKGADPNLADAHGRTPVHELARVPAEDLYWSQEKRMELFGQWDISAAIDLYNEYRPCDECLCQGHARSVRTAGGYVAEIIHLLVKAGVDLQVTARDGCTPWDVAVREKYQPMIRELLRRGLATSASADGQNTGTVTDGKEENQELTPEENALRLIYAPWHKSVATDLVQLALDGEYTVLDQFIALGGDLAEPVPDPLSYDPERQTQPVIQSIASYGLSSVLEMPRVRAQIARADSHGKWSVIRSACWRACSNMAVVRILVDTPGVTAEADDVCGADQPLGSPATDLIVSKLIQAGHYWCIEAVDLLLTRDEEYGQGLLARKALKDSVKGGGDWKCETAKMIIEKHNFNPTIALDDDENIKIDTLTSCLWLAEKDTAMMELLIRHGARLVAKPGLLHSAIRRMDIDMARILVEHGAPIMADDDVDRYWSDEWDETEDEDEDDEDDENLGIYGKPIPETDATCDVIARQRTGPQPFALHTAVRPRFFHDWESGDEDWGERQLEMVKMLLRLGIDPLARHLDGDTALHAAIEDHGLHIDTVILPRLELDGRLEVDIIGKSGKTLLHSACIPTRPPDHRSHINGDEWRDPIVAAPVTSKPKIILALLRLGADPLCKDDIFQRTPLHWLCTQREASLSGASYLEAFKALISRAPASITLTDKDGFTPFELAFQNYQLEICNLLLDKDFLSSIISPSSSLFSNTKDLRRRFISKTIANTIDTPRNPLHHLAPALTGTKESTVEATVLFRRFLSADPSLLNQRSRVPGREAGRTPFLIYLSTDRNPHHHRRRRKFDSRDADFTSFHLPNLDLFFSSSSPSPSPSSPVSADHEQDGYDKEAEEEEEEAIHADDQGNGPLHVTAGRKVGMMTDDYYNCSAEWAQVGDIVGTFERLMMMRDGEKDEGKDCKWGFDPRRGNKRLQTAVDIAVASGRGKIVELFREKGERK